MRCHWQWLASRLVPGAVVSHISALAPRPAGGLILSEGGAAYATLSHPTRFNRTVRLPGLRLVLLRGPGPLPGDLPLADSGLHWASRHRALLENLGRVVKHHPTRAGRAAVARQLQNLRDSGGAEGLHRMCEAARSAAEALGLGQALEELLCMAEEEATVPRQLPPLEHQR
jgi:hypothetical protein